MAETRPNNRIISPEMAIPSGLNRIRTRRAPVKEKPSSRPDDLTESRSFRPPMRPKPKKKSLPHGYGETSNSLRKVERGRTKIAKWFSSYIHRSSPQASNDVMCSEDAIIEYKTNHKGENAKTVLGHESNQLNGNQASVDGESSGKVAKSFKSFSDELGPKGGIQSSYPRFHSYDNLKELLGSLHSHFDSTKVIVNVELNCLLEDIMNAVGTIDPPVESRTMAEDLMIVAERCIEMTSFQFRLKCESIVQDLTEKRQKCQGSLVKWFYTRMLFILTRCTRLLQFQKGSEEIDDNSLRRFKKCIESIPVIDSSCLPRGTVDCHTFGLHGKPEVEHNCTKEDQVVSSMPTWASFLVPTKQMGINATEDLFSARNETASQASQFGLVISQDQPDDNDLGNCMRDQSFSLFSNHEHLDSSLVKPEGVRTVEASEPVICRICEEVVPVSHLESHSYICAYADKCASNCMNIDECLVKIEEILEQIIESRDASSHHSLASPESSRLQNLCSAITSECYSPKVSEWRNKGLEGMFEDIHDMDTASIEDSHISPVDLKGYLNMKLGNQGPSSSTGSLTSVSSTNTPRAGQFDSFWLEHNNPSELEDMQQMIDLADVARCVAGTDISKDGSYDFLLACMHDLQDILRHSKLKALVVDTFGGRIEKLLREKYILACEAMNVNIPSSYQEGKEISGLTSDNMPQSCSVSTPLVSHKERTSIDDFEIIKPISRGAFGKVFLARKRVTGDLFAIKVLKKLDMIRKNDIERILAERNILITVRNPFVVRFFYSFTCRENLYLVMEYLNGGDLFSLLRTLGCLGEEVARTYIAELVLALEYLHSLGIVHRDLKPDNILIAHDGHIKLTDFGLSRIGLVNNTVDLSGQERSDDSAVHTRVVEDGDGRQHSAVGTPDYLAPEILLGTEHGYAVDWWSVGIILFELLTGVPPFSNEQPEIIFDNILNGKIMWPSIPNQMSFQAQDFINRLLIHDPTMRLGANGPAEVKAHTFFNGVNWENLTLQKAAFVPELDGADDTSYFVSRFIGSSGNNPDCHDCSSSDTDVSRSTTNLVAEADECGDFAEFESTPLNLSLINFSFKNLSQLASMNHDVLLQTGQDSTKEQAK